MSRGADAVERAEPAHQHEVAGRDSCRCARARPGRPASRRRTAGARRARRRGRCCTPRASVKVWQRSQWRTSRDRLLQRAREPLRAVAVVLQQVEGHALRRLRRRRRAGGAAPRPAPSSELVRPSGRRAVRTATSCRAAGGMPAVSLPIFSWLTSSARRTPSLKAAATRSSSMSLSSAEQARVDGDALDVVLAGHRDLDEAGARLAFDLDRGELVLRLLEVVLHRLGLLHQAGELTSSSWSCAPWNVGFESGGLTEPGTMRAVLYCAISACTSGSSWIDLARPRAGGASRSAASRRAGRVDGRAGLDLEPHRRGRSARASAACSLLAQRRRAQRSRARRAAARLVGVASSTRRIAPACASSRTSAVMRARRRPAA